jgi:hypothetical protein
MYRRKMERLLSSIPAAGLVPSEEDSDPSVDDETDNDGAHNSGDERESME